jgi:hypothetical protein
MRGRLIFPFLTDIAILDTETTAEDPLGTGPVGLGYDDEFREPILEYSATDRGVRRKETIVRLPVQFEDDLFESLNMMSTGRSPQSALRAILHFKDLERLDLIQDDGIPKLKINDRLVAVYEKGGVLLQAFPNPPGVFCIESQPRLGGLCSHRNLLLMTFRSRDLSVPA